MDPVIAMDKDTLTKALIGAAVGYLIFEYIKAKTPEVISLVNPADANNVVNQAASAGVEKATGGKFLSVGDFLFSLFNPNAPGEHSITQFGISDGTRGY